MKQERNRSRRSGRPGSLIGLLLVLALSVSACSGNKAGNNVGAQTSPGSGQPAASSSAPPAQESADSAPKAIRFLASHGNSAYALQYKEAGDPYLKELSRLSGYEIHYEFLGHSTDFEQQMTLRFASNDLADVVRTDSILSTIHPGAVEQGIFHELGGLIEQYGPNIKKNVPQAAWDSARITKDGKIYGIPVILPISNYRAVYIRQDWLDKLQMKQPVTVEEYLQFFEAVKREDVNGNGDPDDEYGFYVRENLSYSEIFFKEISGYHPREWTYRDGKLQPGIIQPEMKEAIRFWKDMFDKGYVNPNMFTNTSSDWMAGIKQGLGGIWTHDAQSVTTQWGPELFVNEKNVRLDLVGPPVGPAGKGGLSAESEGINYVWVIPSSNKHPEEVIKYLDWAWSSPEANKFFSYGIEGSNYIVDNGEVKFDATLPINKENNPAEFFRIFINPVKIGSLDPSVLDLDPNAELMKKGLAAAQEGIFTSDDFHMPVLDAIKSNPELGFGASTLFMDMFAKVLTGSSDLDAAFDGFLNEWQARGGGDAIAEATAWYKTFHNIQ